MNENATWDSVETRLYALTSPDSLSGLSFLRRIFARLGDPCGFPAIHIAGTNGKGSTAADIDAILRAQGYKSALYTSPHLLNVGERLLVNGEPLPPARWHEALDRVESAMRAEPDVRLGYFQITTAACFLMITEERVDAAVIETGLGGRLDATNILPAPLISIITPLDIDHVHILGKSLPEIAAHKFDIVKPGCRALYCGGSDDLNRQFSRKCREVAARGEIFSETSAATEIRTSLEGSSFHYRSPGGERDCFVRLAGLHQPENAALAMRALEILRDELPMSPEAVERGLRTVQWPGRLEVLRRDPDIVIDGAHNPHATRSLVRSLKALYGATPLIFVYTAMADKDYRECLKIYAEAFPTAQLYCTEIPSARCEKSVRLADVASRLFSRPPKVVPDPMAAIREAARDGGPVIVCGSLYLIAVIKEEVKRS